jgi:glucose-1-phosphate adenylyltransferase
MLEYHIEKRADVTISLIEVPWAEANRFGIMNTNEDMRIVEFEEKPSNPKNNLASMGIYIFSWNVLKEYLEMDDRNPDSSHDFGKDVIPLLLEENKKLYAFPFKGYWKDVGTVQSLWEANMDLLNENCDLDLFDQGWKIYTVNPNQPPQYISPDANIKESLINEGCTIEGEIEKSVLFQSVTIEKGSKIIESVIMPDASVGKNCFIEKAIVPCDVTIPDGTVIRSLDGEIILVTEEMISGIYPDPAIKN